MRKPRQRKEKELPQVTQIYRTEIFTLSTYLGATLAIAQALGDLGRSHITRPPNKPPLLVLLCLVGPGWGWFGRKKWSNVPMKGQAFTPKWLPIQLRDQMSDLVKPSAFSTRQSASHLS